jgi:hypothetical protein
MTPHLPDYRVPGVGVGPHPAGGYTFDTGSVGRTVLFDVPVTKYLGDVDVNVTATLDGKGLRDLRVDSISPDISF